MPATPLGRIRRLADGAVFQALLRKGKRHSRGVVTARVLQGKDVGRLGLSIAKRHLRLATDRNTMKRIVREAYRARGLALAGQDVLFMLTEGSRAKEDRKLLPDQIKRASGRRELRVLVDSVLDQIQRPDASFQDS